MTERWQPGHFEQESQREIPFYTSSPFDVIHDDRAKRAVSFGQLNSRSTSFFLCGVRFEGTADMCAVKLSPNPQFNLLLPFLVPEIVSRLPQIDSHALVDVASAANDFLHDRRNLARAEESRPYVSALELAQHVLPLVDVQDLDCLALCAFAEGIPVNWRATGRTKNLVELGSAPFLDALAQSKIL